MVTQPIKGLEWKCVISAVTDFEDWENGTDLRIPYNDMHEPRAELFGDYVLKGLDDGSGGGDNFTKPNTDDFGMLEQPNHYQDRIHRNVIDKDGRGGTPQRDLEFELDVDSITHTWQGLTSPIDLPMLNPLTDNASGELSMPRNTAGGVIYQLNALAMDLGMSNEQISLKGRLIDRENPPHQTATGAPHVRKQQLMDIARGQWAGIGKLGGKEPGKTAMMTPNAWVAITLGRTHSRTQQVGGTAHENEEVGGSNYSDDGVWVESYFFGDEPSDDIRGKERLRNDNKPLTLSPAANNRASATAGLVNRSGWEFDGTDNTGLFGDLFWDDDPDGYVKEGVSSESRVLRDWDYKFHYDGRNRYRGVIKDLSLSHTSGRPDVWEYSITFAIIKNETKIRHLESD